MRYYKVDTNIRDKIKNDFSASEGLKVLFIYNELCSRSKGNDSTMIVDGVQLMKGYCYCNYDYFIGYLGTTRYKVRKYFDYLQQIQAITIVKKATNKGQKTIIFINLYDDFF